MDEYWSIKRIIENEKGKLKKKKSLIFVFTLLMGHMSSEHDIIYKVKIRKNLIIFNSSNTF